MPAEDIVRITVRVPRPLSEAMDKAVQLGIYPSKNQLILEAVSEHLRVLSFAISIRVKAKRKASNAIDYYRFLAEGIQEALLSNVGATYTAISERVGVALERSSIDQVEQVGKEISELLSNLQEEVIGEDTAQGGDVPHASRDSSRQQEVK